MNQTTVPASDLRQSRRNYFRRFLATGNPSGGSFLPFAVMALLLLPAPVPAEEPSQTDYAPVKKDLVSFIRREMDRQHVKGLSLALVDGSRAVWGEGFGFADESRKIPATADTLYRLQSVSKIFTAVEIMRLAEQGLVRLDQPLTQYLPEFYIQSRFKQALPITLRSLLAHHSGIPASYLPGMWVENEESLAQLVEYLAEDYLVSPPQTLYKYSNLDYCLLGRVIERQTGRPFAEALKEDLLEPLGMDSSTFDLTPGVKERLAKAYCDGKETPPVFLRDVPTGGMVSSADDMARFLQFLFTGAESPVKTATIEAMYQEQYGGLPLDFGHKVGLGWQLSGLDIPGSEITAWHDGVYPPYTCQVAVLPKEKLGVVVLSNTAEVRKGFGEELVTRALKLMLEAKAGVRADLSKPKAVMPKLVQVPEEKINRYVGYYSGFGKAARISKGGSHLRADLMDNQFDLIPTSENKFIPRVTALFFDIHIPQYSVEFTQVEGKDVAILTGKKEPLVFEKINPMPIPHSWEECLGKYQMDDPDGDTEFKDMTLEEKDGLLTVNAKVTCRVFYVKDVDYKIAVEPISDEDLVVMGLFYPNGDTIHATRENGQIRLYYAGLRFTKTDNPGKCYVCK
jgi:CubicO group peptidase (beta-lactamase class C family)